MDSDIRTLQRAAATGDGLAIARLQACEARGDASPSDLATTRALHRGLRGLKLAVNAFERETKRLARVVWEARQRRQVHPSGTFDNASRWMPDPHEDPGSVIQRTIRSPSRAWPYSYMTACRSRAHCLRLVRHAIAGDLVPYDVRDIVTRALENIARAENFANQERGENRA